MWKNYRQTMYEQNFKLIWAYSIHSTYTEPPHAVVWHKYLLVWLVSCNTLFKIWRKLLRSVLRSSSLCLLTCSAICNLSCMSSSPLKSVLGNGTSRKVIYTYTRKWTIEKNLISNIKQEMFQKHICPPPHIYRSKTCPKQVSKGLKYIKWTTHWA